MSPPSLEQRAEKRLGSTLRERYRLVSVLGIGGMATVYLAQHRNGNRVALKMLHAELSVEEDLRARFVREGYVANAIEHPGTVRVLDDDVAEDGSAFLVMELLEGATVYDRARALGGTLSIEEVTWLGWHLLDVLAAAHEKGVIHRDIKPENLFVTDQGALKVLDFGIARVRDGSGSAPTRTGRAMGTPAFMPPEQALGRQSEIDPRTDVWAVGATLFSLLSGQLVHVATTPEEHVVYAATQLARPLISVAPDVPVPLAIVVDRALAFAKEGRWERARAMQSALAAAHKAMFGIPVAHAAPPAPIAAAPTPAPVQRPSSGDRTVHAPAPPALRATAMADTTRAPSPRPAPPATPTVRSPGTPPQEPARWPTDATASLSAARLPAATTSPGAPSETEPQDAAPPEQPSPPKASPKRSWLPAAALMVVAAGLGFLATRRTLGPHAPVASASASATTGCASNAACAAGAICRRATGACVPLDAGRCRAVADDATRRSDDTVWIGVMFPQTGPDAALYGMGSVRAVELGRRDFVDIANGFPRTTGPARPIGLLVCDDAEDPTSSADHLARVGVPAIIGFSRSKEVLDLAASHFNPLGILALASNQAPMLAGIPRAPTGERMVFRTTTSATMVVEPTALFITQELAKDVEAASAGRKEPLRVALLRPQNATGLGYAEAFVRSLRIDGRPLAERPDSFRQLVRPDVPPTPADLRATVDELIAYAPHVIMDDYWNGPGLIEAVEAAWPKGRLRPRWLWGSLSEEDVAALHAKRDLGKRLFRIDTPASTSANARYVLRHNEVFPDKVTARTATDAPYDAFYALAYALLSLGDAEPTGTALARAMARIVPPGAPVEVGPGGIFDALSVLRRGQNVDLIGTTTSLDFDRETGDPTADFVVYGATEKGSAETGLTFSAKTRTLSGKRAEHR